MALLLISREILRTQDYFYFRTQDCSCFLLANAFKHLDLDCLNLASDQEWWWIQDLKYWSDLIKYMHWNFLGFVFSSATSTIFQTVSLPSLFSCQYVATCSRWKFTAKVRFSKNSINGSEKEAAVSWATRCAPSAVSSFPASFLSGGLSSLQSSGCL